MFNSQHKQNIQNSRSKRWKPCNPPPMEGMVSSTSDNDDEEIDDEIHLGDKVQDTRPQSSPMAPSVDHAPLTSTETLDNNASLGILKWTHELTYSDYDKESPSKCNDNLQIALFKLPSEGWVKVLKKKGKKGRLEDRPQFRGFSSLVVSYVPLCLLSILSIIFLCFDTVTKGHTMP